MWEGRYKDGGVDRFMRSVECGAERRYVNEEINSRGIGGVMGDWMDGWQGVNVSRVGRNRRIGS